MTTESQEKPPYRDWLSPEERRRASSRGGQATAERLTPEERSEKARRGAGALHASVTREQLSEWGKRGAAATNAAMTAEQRRERARKGAVTLNAMLTPEQRSRTGHFGAMSRNAHLTPEQRQAISRKGGQVAQARRLVRLAEWRRAWLVATPWPHAPGTPCAKAVTCGGEAFAHSLCMACCLVALAPATHAIGSVA